MRTLLIYAAPLALLACSGSSDTEEETSGNSIPVADAGPDLSVTADNDIVLDGSGSFDPDGDKLTYIWSFSRVPPESQLTLEGNFPNNRTSTNTSALRPDVPGTYIVKLKVRDVFGNESLDNDTSTAVINVQPGSAPVADAGGDQTRTLPGSVELDGSKSYDPLGRDLTYQWQLTSIPTNSTNPLNETGLTTPTMRFTPDVGGRYVVSLTVNNGLADSDPSVAYVDVFSTTPSPPVADAGPDFPNAFDCTEILLDGSGSFDPNEDVLQYQWTLQEKPATSNANESNFGDLTAQTTTFYPDVIGEYLISLSVFDGTSWSAPDLVRINAQERNFNSPPNVLAGSDLFAEGGSGECVLDGYTFDCGACEGVTVTLGLDAAVSDIDGDPTTYEWRAIGNVEVDIAEPTSLTTTATLFGAAADEPGSCADNTYVFELVATDCPQDSNSDRLEVVISCCGVEPTEDSGS